MWGQNQNTTHNWFDISDTQVREDKPTTKVLFLHGALHLYRNAKGRTFKKVWSEKGNLLDIFKNVQGDAIPLFISEGTWQDKYSAIARSDYLSFAYERFSNHRRSLVVFGHSLTPDFDNHLIKAMLNWKDQTKPQDNPERPVIAISVRPGNESHAIIDLKSRLINALSGLSNYDVRFFDSRTHPLGKDDLQIKLT